MKVKIGSTYIKSRYVEVRSLQHASKMVRDFIEQNDCVAGCGSSDNVFKGGEVLQDGEKIANVTYNGRVWDLAKQEIRI